MEKQKRPRQDVRQEGSLSIWRKSQESEHCPGERPRDVTHGPGGYDLSVSLYGPESPWVPRLVDD